MVDMGTTCGFVVSSLGKTTRLVVSALGITTLSASGECAWNNHQTRGECACLIRIIYLLRTLLLGRGLYIVDETGRRRTVVRGCLATSCVVVGD